MSDIDTIIYFVGVDRENAENGLPFDSEDSAQDYAQDNPGTQVFVCDATIHLDTMRPVD